MMHRLRMAQQFFAPLRHFNQSACHHLPQRTLPTNSDSIDGQLPSTVAPLKPVAAPIDIPPWPVDSVEFNSFLPDGGHGERQRQEAAKANILQLSKSNMLSSSPSLSFQKTKQQQVQAADFAVLLLKELQALNPIGTIISNRDQALRWRCSSCNRFNSLRIPVCRTCGADRYHLTDIQCKKCQQWNPLNNEMLYFHGMRLLPSPAGRSSQDYSPECWIDPTTGAVLGRKAAVVRFGKQMSCRGCGNLVHGCLTRSGQFRCWFCACGYMNPLRAHTCLRCRLPQVLQLSPQETREMLKQYDTTFCTQWCCARCNAINAASKLVILPKVEGGTQKEGHMIPGTTCCCQCGAPWHAGKTNNGLSWLCACHTLNGTGSSSEQDAHATEASPKCLPEGSPSPKKVATPMDVCTNCELPRLQGLSPNLLSTWRKGDWCCLQCHRHNYPKFSICSCGAPRNLRRL